MGHADWGEALLAMLRRMEAPGARPELTHVRPGITAYAIPSFDGTALQFAFPVAVERDLISESGLPVEGVDGAVGAVIEHLKARAKERRELGALFGHGTTCRERYVENTEPCTLIRSERVSDTLLWRPNAHNWFRDGEIHLSLRGAVPWPGPPGGRALAQVEETLSTLIGAVGEEVHRAPEGVLKEWWRTSLDQKVLRRRLPELGLVSFVGDGARPARSFTRARCFPAVAGPKEGVHIPFRCPPELGPVEVTLEGSNVRATGLGIREGEIFAVIGSNAEGKSTFLQAILSGEDDHAPGDGRERIVTRAGCSAVEASPVDMQGSDVSLFFRSLPPGIMGTPHAVFGPGSASLGMAQQIQQAIRRGAPLIAIDEDRSAANLLVPSCVHSEGIVPLSALLARERHRLGGTGLLIAASALDVLIAEADRIMLLRDHIAAGMDRKVFRRLLHRRLSQLVEALAGFGKSDSE